MSAENPGPYDQEKELPEIQHETGSDNVVPFLQKDVESESVARPIASAQPEVVSALRDSAIGQDADNIQKRREELLSSLPPDRQAELRAKFADEERGQAA